MTEVFDDLRAYRDALAAAGQLYRVPGPVDPDMDLPAAACADGRIENAPALWFDNIAGYYPGTTRVLMGGHGNPRNWSVLLGQPRDTHVRDLVELLADRWHNYPVPPVHRTDPPWLANTLADDDVDLYQVIPLFRMNERDSGAYIDKAAVVTAPPDDPDAANAGIYRLRMERPNRLTIQVAPVHDGAEHLRLAEQRGQNLPVAIVIGGDPMVPVVAGCPLDYGQSEWAMCGTLRGAPMSVATAPHTGLPVPAGAEAVIEGEIIGRAREWQGYFAEVPGSYSGGRLMPPIRIDRIHYRDDPIFDPCYIGRAPTETDWLVGPPTCAAVLMQLRAKGYPEVRAVNALTMHGMTVIVSMAAPSRGSAKDVGLAALSTPHGRGYMTRVKLVDEHIDPFNREQVDWAEARNANPSLDEHTIDDLSVISLAPAALPRGRSGKKIVDATAPVPPDPRAPNFARPVNDPQRTPEWEKRIRAAVAEGTTDGR